MTSEALSDFQRSFRPLEAFSISGDLYIHEVATPRAEETAEANDACHPSGHTMSIPSRPWEEKTADGTVGVFSNEPMREPLTAAVRAREAGRTSNLIEPLPQSATPARWTSVRIAIKDKRGILLIDAADLIAVEAKGNLVLLRRTSSSHMLRESISMMEEKLNPHGFVRIHRSVVVNAALVEEIQPRPAGESILRVKGGREYKVTRTYKKNLQVLAQSWIGTAAFIAE